MVVKSQKVDNPIREFFGILFTFFADIWSKPTREKIVSRSLGPISGLFAFLSILTLIYIIIDSTEDETNPETKKRAKNSMIYISFGLTTFITGLLVFAIVFHKNVPLIRYVKI